MVMEFDTTSSSPTLMTSVVVIPDREERDEEERDMLRSYGMANRLNYSDEDVDEEREMEASPGLQSQTFRKTEGQRTQGIPLLLAAHLRETEKRRRTLSPRETSFAHASLPNT
uniref:Uncharacterized protein n=1 Tax=Tanacetum cinerariifolium TaxID=118510 RepID=A0A699JRQ9_TANCI|nr:hypothetical protein [Tanacetum cinerariifolium]